MKTLTPIFIRYCETMGLPAPVAEHRFHDTRKWRFDYAWLDAKVALEVQGGIFIRGRHTRGGALLKEWEKLNTAAAMGWRVLYCQPSELMSRETMGFIQRAIIFGE